MHTECCLQNVKGRGSWEGPVVGTEDFREAICEDMSRLNWLRAGSW